jgi:ElaB/YqjD/DUF883 family membrane-anchored ribosome-binding protein
MANQTNGTTAARPQKIADALRTLDEAIMSEGANLKDLVTKDYGHLQSALQDFAPQFAQTLRDKGGEYAKAAQEYAGPALERTRQVAGTVDTQVRKNPWPVIGGVAFGALALGFLFGRSNSN